MSNEMTSSRFESILPATVLLDDRLRRSSVRYAEHFLTGAVATVLFDRLMHETPFETEAPVMFGRPVEVRRTSISFREIPEDPNAFQTASFAANRPAK